MVVGIPKVEVSCPYCNKSWRYDLSLGGTNGGTTRGLVDTIVDCTDCGAGLRIPPPPGASSVVSGNEQEEG